MATLWVPERALRRVESRSAAYRVLRTMATPKTSRKSVGKDRGEGTLSSASQGNGAAALGMTYGATILLFVGVGWWLDDHFGTSPWLLIAGSLLGATGGFISLVKKVPPAGAGRDPGDDSHFKK